MKLRLPLAALALAATTLLTPWSATPLTAQLGPGPGGRAPYAAQPRTGNEAGRFDYYLLSLSWSPSYCAGLQRGGYDPQCHARDGRRYSFVLHGLWPQFERGWPRDCPTASRPFVPQPLINSMLDIMPSPKLVIHEYRQHGTCSGLAPAEYFATARQYYQKVVLPPRYINPNQAFTVSPTEVVRDFVAVNPNLKPESIAVVCGGSGNRLREVRICLSREGTTRPCGRNEGPRRLCAADRLYVPPVRGAAPEGGNGGGVPRPGIRPDERRI